MSDSSVTIDRLEPFQIALQLTAQVTFDQDFASRDRLNDFVDLVGRQILGSQIRVDISPFQDPFSRAWTNSVNVSQGRFNPFLGRNFYS
jgi:hypothetical protein